ncbi:hypothetical protein Apa02nite_087300 [Actinoplanes palleronii]|uniref:Uncharacterized protein n=1 Tax=Actinoplanes palleronii TaxID=113570 RepID=A0ABQ4BPL9_9ACTN|nr:hypothetical protein Apa02nite_087300 [Actinoplanes palleronii]
MYGHSKTVADRDAAYASGAGLVLGTLAEVQTVAAQAPAGQRGYLRVVPSTAGRGHVRFGLRLGSSTALAHAVAYTDGDYGFALPAFAARVHAMTRLSAERYRIPQPPTGARRRRRPGPRPGPPGIPGRPAAAHRLTPSHGVAARSGQPPLVCIDHFVGPG